jgi:hypothetical protein
MRLGEEVVVPIRLVIVSLFAFAGCTYAPSPPPQAVLLSPPAFNTEPWAGTQSPSAPYVGGTVQQPFQTPNSLPLGAATTISR